jgi:ParB-like chromosome segregation protein Spo0J
MGEAEQLSATEEIIDEVRRICDRLGKFEVSEKVSVINAVRRMISEAGPFANEPVDCVEWVLADSVVANTYNPNRVAPPEMKLLELSITSDGYTQPIVTYGEDDKSIVVDGFHRNRIGKESEAVRTRLNGYLPIVRIREGQAGADSRMASTIRHNRARGKHQVDAMTDIILELSKRNWSDSKISKELGMDADEVLRFKQIGGLAELFADKEFSEAWEIDEEQIR